MTAERVTGRHAPAQTWSRWPAAAYVLAFMLEGVLRKWVAPGAGGPLFFLKDVAVVAMLLSGLRRRHAGVPTVVWWVFVLAGSFFVFGAVQTILLNASLYVFLAGLHGYVFPILAAVGLALIVGDVPSLRLALKTYTVVLVVQAPLVIAQSVASPTAFINKLPPGAAVLGVANGLIRASGFLTSTTGLTAEVSLAMALSLWQLSTPRPAIPRSWSVVLLMTATISALFSGNRGDVVAIALLYAVALGCAAAKAQGKLLAGIVGGGVAIALSLMLVPQYRTALSDRFQSASQQENTTARIEGMFIIWHAEAPNSPVLGSGMGSASHAGLLVTNNDNSSWIENDLPRTVHELGVFGLFVVVFRWLIGIALLVAALVAFARGDPGLLPFAAGLMEPILAGAVTQQGDVGAAAAMGLGVFVVAARQVLRRPAVNVAPSARSAVRSRALPAT